MAFCNPSRTATHAACAASRPKRSGPFLRAAAFALPVFFALSPLAASAQGIELVRDTEIERVLFGYERPLLEAANIDPDTVKIYINQDPTINAFATQSPIEGQTEAIFVNTGIIQQLQTPNQLIGVLAHETGHIAGGDIVRGGQAMEKASVPMLIGMAVAIVAMVAGAGQAGMGALALGQQVALAQFLEFSRAQEATADQRGVTYLNRTHQSAEGMLEVFAKLANEQAMSAYYNKTFVSDHPADRERIDELQTRVNASPYREVKDSPAVVHEFHMMQAKLTGYLSDPDSVLKRYPPGDVSDEALYARAMAYFRKPDMKKALAEISTLTQREPKNPYFWEMYGQIQVEMAKPRLGIVSYQKSVDLLPDAPLIRVALAQAQLATDDKALAKPALENLKIAVQQERENPFAWYEEAQAYSILGQLPEADLATAERDYWGGNPKEALMFASRAAMKLPRGTTEWQRATDIVSITGAQLKKANGRG